PYMKRSSAVAKLGAGSSRESLYQTVKPRMTSRASTMPATTVSVRCFPSAMSCSPARSSALEGLQVLHQGLLVGSRERRPIGASLVPGVGVAQNVRVVAEVAPPVLLGDVGGE